MNEKRYTIKCDDCGESRKSFISLKWKPYIGKKYRCAYCAKKYVVSKLQAKSSYNSLTSGYVWESYIASGQKKLRTKIECPTCHQIRWVNKSNMIIQKKSGKWTGNCFTCVLNSRIGTKSQVWKGGRIKLPKSGYIVVLLRKEDPYFSMADGMKSPSGSYCYEHRYLIAKKVGRVLKTNEQVHHINFKRDDNRIENLQLYTASEHQKLHARLRLLHKV